MGNRIYYAIHDIGIRPMSSGSGPYSAIHGVQNIGISTNVMVTPVPYWGTYDTTQIEDGFENSINLTKLLDGYSPVFLNATSDSPTPYITDRVMQRCDLAMSLFDDMTVWDASGIPIGTVQYSGIYPVSVKYSFSNANASSEEISFVGSNKIWANDVRIINVQDSGVSTSLSFNGPFNDRDAPNTYVSRRWHFILNGTGTDVSILPVEVTGKHITNVTLSIPINRSIIPTFGEKDVYFRMPNFPLEITTEITVAPTGRDELSFSEGGILTTSLCSDRGNISGQLIQIATCDGFRAYLGTDNKLRTISQNGGDAGGGIMHYTYTYKTYNTCTLTHKTDKFWDTRGTWFYPPVSTGLDWNTLTYDGWANMTIDQLGNILI